MTGLAYVDSSLPDRGADVRSDAERVAAAEAHPAARCLVLRGRRHSPLCTKAGPGEHRLLWLPLAALQGRREGNPQPLVLLGFAAQGEPHFALAVADAVQPADLTDHAEAVFPQDVLFLRLADNEDSGTLAHAMSLLDWNARNPFCTLCGAPTVSIDAGHKRQCTGAACPTRTGLHNVCFPRTDPSVIMLVHDGADRCLLGHNRKFPAGFWSCLAGFVEPGETLEAAVAREVLEETGIPVLPGTLQYVQSQPWPFPNSLMIGFLGQGDASQPIVPSDEIEEARWVPRTEVQQALDAAAAYAVPDGSPFRLPPPTTLAHVLIRKWAFPECKL
eukprot:EG_transcript_14358